MEKTLIELGFGVSIETIKSFSADIYNLKSNKKDVMNLGVRLFE